MRKQYNRTRYQINKTLEVICWTEDTSYGFRHLTQLENNGRVVGQAKACYYNRTWERYDYESVIHKLIDASEIRNKQATKKKIDNKALGVVEDTFKTIGAVMALGDLFSNDRAEANDWKRRMLQAGIGDALQVPDDWEQLSEADKEQRLNKVVKEFTK